MPASSRTALDHRGIRTGERGASRSPVGANRIVSRERAQPALRAGISHRALSRFALFCRLPPQAIPTTDLGSVGRPVQSRAVRRTADSALSDTLRTALVEGVRITMCLSVLQAPAPRPGPDQAEDILSSLAWGRAAVRLAWTRHGTRVCLLRSARWASSDRATGIREPVTAVRLNAGALGSRGFWRRVLRPFSPITVDHLSIPSAAPGTSDW